MTNWKIKLAAYLHDPPSKPFNIAEHRQIAQRLIQNAGLDLAEAALFYKICDHTAAAADRVVCPKSSALRSDWNQFAAFRHPLGGGELVFDAPITPAQAEDVVEHKQPYGYNWASVPDKTLANGAVRPGADWARFFIHWRLWPQTVAESDPRLVHMPAGTRIPDHTIWTHCGLVSALESSVRLIGEGEDASCELKPAFLLVQLGPVQEFIAQARTTRDLWSGSYLLSWLIAHGIKAVADHVGPDCVLFPAMCGQPLFDFMHKAELYDPLEIWPDLHHAPEHILTPNLPNRFLAVVPEWQSKELAELAEKAIQEELCKNISKACLEWFKHHNRELPADALARWEQQMRQFLAIHWQTWPWEPDVAAAINGFHALPSGCRRTDEQTVSPAEALRLGYDAGSKGIPTHALDPRNYRHRSWIEGEVWKSDIIPNEDGLPIIDNPGFAWAAHYAAADFRLAARRNTRAFEPWALGDDKRRGTVKDMLSGKEETVGSEEWQRDLAKIPGHYFREGERLGAMNLLKRIWHAAYLDAKKGLKRQRISFDSVPAVAAAHWRSILVQKIIEEEAVWTGFLDFASCAVGARDLGYFDIPKEKPDKSSKLSEHKWLACADASIFHPNEWSRVIRDESKREGDPRQGAIDRLSAGAHALAALQDDKGGAAMGKPFTYVAILEIDGDSMGQWLSGAKSPRLEDQLAPEALEYFRRVHAEAREPEALKRLLRAPRHVSPSYHLQFSEALANFSLYLVGPIIEFFNGQLIYSGGDDVLAMLPAERALDCARALWMAFRGDPELWRCFDRAEAFDLAKSHSPFLPAKPEQWGFVGVNGQWKGWQRWEKAFLKRGYHLLVPGKRANISAGIAIGHMHTPLQNLIKAARRAEKAAKEDYGKAAFAVHLFKRSGDYIRWGAKWNQGAINLADEFTRLTDEKRLSAKFPYTLTAALKPYTLQVNSALARNLDAFQIQEIDGFDPFAVFECELRHVLRRQSEQAWLRSESGRSEADRFLGTAAGYLRECATRRLDDFIGPFLTTAFIHRPED